MLPPPAAIMADFGRVRDLAVARLAPHLRGPLVQEAVSVQAPGRQLAAVGVQRQLPVAGDAFAALDERPALADAAQPERLEPRHREPREPVVELGHLHVGRGVLGPLPHLFARGPVGHRGEVVELVPRGPSVDPHADGLDPQGRVSQILGPIAPGHDDRGRAVARNVAVVETKRRRDHARREVVVHRHRVAVDRLRVERGVAARVQGDPRELLSGRAVLVEVALGKHRNPDRGRRRRERQVPFHEAGRLEPAAAPATTAGHDRSAALFALGRTLVDRAEAEHMIREPRRDRQAGVHDRAELAGRFEPAAVPTALQAQGVDHLVRARAGETGRRAHRPGIGRHPVDVVGGQTGVLDRREATVEGQVERIAEQPAPDVGLADPGDARTSLDDLVFVHGRHSLFSVAGSKRGR